MSVPKTSTQYDELEVKVLTEYDPIFVTVRDWSCSCGHIEISYRGPKAGRVGFCRLCGQGAVILIHPDDEEAQK